MKSKISPSARITERVEIEHPIEVSPHAFFSSGSIGKFTFINWNCKIFDEVHIGRYSTLARDVSIGGAEHPLDWLSSSFAFVKSGQFNDIAEADKIVRRQRTNSKKTIIGNDVWIGASAIINKGVNIGSGSVIAGGAVVVKDVPPYAIVGGNPASHIRYRFDHGVIAALLRLQWWDIELDDIAALPFDDIYACISELEKIRSSE